jgi:beta-lactam-binding protein with PASTA domain
VNARVDRDISDPLVGRLLDGRYQIGARIARGGMAGVYEATDVRLDRTVAVKVMHPGMADDGDFAARFVREARAAAKLSHPHVVAVFDQGDEDGVVYLAMEYVPGHTLRDVIRKEAPMPPAKALALLDPVLSALGAAHHAHLVHRDVKPENVLIADDGRIKVADFGLARAVGADTQHTATGGVLIGTVSYLAPELVVEGRADARADVYAAGVVLFELLTGRKPHEGESPIQVAYKHVHEDVPAPSTLVPGIPAYVDALVARATARDRSLRPADARVMLHQLHRVKQALDEGVVDEPELYADLMPPVLSAATLASRVAGTDTQQFDAVDAETEHAPDTEPDLELDELPEAHAVTSQIDRHEVMAATPPPAAHAPRSPAPPTAHAAHPRGRRSRRGLVLLLVGLLLAAGTGVGAWYFGWARYTSTPGVIELTEAKARDKVDAAGLDFEVGDTAYDEQVPAGNVISSDPGAGERVLEGGTVTVVISKGQERYEVPVMRGDTEDQAQQKILDAHLEFGRSVPKYNEKIPAGQVIASNPKAGTSLKPGTAVDLYLSQGPKPIRIPDFTGRSAERAEKWFDARGLEVDVAEEYDDEVAEGQVISQDPSTGHLFKGDTVELVVSQGPELVTIPRVRAMGVSAATEKLEDLGLEVETRHTRGYLSLGYVYDVSPGEAEKVPKGSTVILYLV